MQRRSGVLWRRKIPLNAELERSEHGWRVRLRVRGYAVRLSRRVVVHDEVRVRARPVRDRRPPAA